MQRPRHNSARCTLQALAFQKGAWFLALPALLLPALTAGAARRNVRDYGAVGNGREDDTAAIQKALSAAVSGDEVFFPAGVYRLTAALTLTRQGISILGEGKQSILRAAGADYPLFRVQADAAVFRDLALEGAATTDKTTQFGIFTTAQKPASHGSVQRCFFTGPEKQTGLNCGIKLDSGSSAWKVEGCAFDHLIGTVSGTGYGILLGNAADCLIRNNRFIGAAGASPQGRHGIYLSGGASRNRVIGNTLRGFNQSSIAVYARANQPACRSNVIQDNQIFGQAAGATGSAAIEISGNVSENRVEKNRIEAPGGIGILVTDALEGGKTKSNRLLSNEIRNAGYFGILLEGALETEARDNTISDASLASPGTYSAIQVQAKTSGAYAQAADGSILSGNRIQGQVSSPHYRWAILLNETIPVPINTRISRNQVMPGLRGDINITAAPKTTLEP